MPFNYAPPTGYQGDFNPAFIHVSSGYGDAPLYAGGNMSAPDGRPSYWDNGDYAPASNWRPGGNGPDMGGTAQNLQALAALRQQGSAMAQQTQPQGLQEPSLDSVNPAVLNSIMRLYGASQMKPSGGIMGNTMFLNGQQSEVPAGVDPRTYLQQQLDAARGPVRTDAQRFGQLQNALSGMAVPYQVKDAIFKQFAGQGMVDYQKMALDLQAKTDELRKTQLGEYNDLARSAGGLPEDILASFGKNAAPGHQNEYFNPGVDLGPDPTMASDPNAPHRVEKAGWRGIDPGTVARLRAIRQTLGIDTQPQMSAAQLAAMEQERQQLLATAQARQQAAMANNGTPIKPLPSGLPAFGPLRPLGVQFWRNMFSSPARQDVPYEPVQVLSPEARYAANEYGPYPEEAPLAVRLRLGIP